MAHGLKRQRGAVLLISLIMLVLLTLAGIGLMRSVSISNVIAGNLAFQQAATHSADSGIETAISFLEANSGSTSTTLNSNILTGAGVRYVAQRQDPASNVSWDSFWSTLASSGAVNTLATDAAGNTVSFVIHRLCNATGVPAYPGCSYSPDRTNVGGNSMGAGVVQLQTQRQIYYRITARVTGPRNTLSYVQVVVAI
jgi:Tfp pilus assembly protein PilX